MNARALKEVGMVGWKGIMGTGPTLALRCNELRKKNETGGALEPPLGRAV